MTTSKRERNIAIARAVRIEGVARSEVARRYKVSPARITQIVSQTNLHPFAAEDEMAGHYRQQMNLHIDKAALLSKQLLAELAQAQKLREETAAFLSKFAARMS